MKNKISIFIVGMLLLLTNWAKVPCYAINDTLTYVELHKTTTDPKLIHRAPNRNPLILECLLFMDTITIVSNQTKEITIVLTNMTTGTVDTYSYIVDDNGVSMPLYDNGDYEIMVSCGTDVYVGEFCVE